MQSSIANFLLNATHSKLTPAIVDIEQDFLRQHNLSHITTGFEQEFYLENPSTQLLETLSQIDGVHEVKPELGENQFEITTIPQVGLVKSCEIVENFRIKARDICETHGTKISFSATISNALPPSSLQLSACFFEKNSNEPLNSTSEILQKIVQNIVDSLPFVAVLTCPTPNCFERIANHNFVRQFKNSPTHATWGVENRTVALRIAQIPDVGKRLEYRIPSAFASVECVAIAFLLSSIVSANDYHLQTFIDSHTSNAPILPCLQNEAMQLFCGSKIEKKLQYYLQKNGI